MFYISNNVMKCVFAMFIIGTSQVFARHKTRRTKYRVDEFIDKLLASKKFDVLAEKFAQKAVERMIHLRPDLRFTKEFASDINTPPKVSFKNVSYKNEVHLEETSVPLKNLSLKFKYFTKGALYQSNENKDTDVKKMEVTTTKMTTDSEKEIKSASDDTDKSINISELESSLQDKPENKSKSLKHNIQRKNERYLNKTTKWQDVDDSLSVENKKNAEISSENELFEYHKTNESRADGATSDFDKNVIKDRAVFSEESNDSLKNNKIKKLRKKRIHREGNRLYTFQSSSDYEEYHQELARVEKERKVFV